MSKAFDKIAVGLADAIAYAGGDKTRRARRARPRHQGDPRQDPAEPGRFRRQLHIPAGTIRDWEQGRRVPDAPARTLLGMVDADPAGALALIAKVKTAA